MIIKPKNLKEAADIIYNVLNQGDSRYNSPEDELLLADFIMHGAISLEERNIPKLEELEELNLQDMKFEVQGHQKMIARRLLILEGYKNEEIQLEVSFRGLRPDILAKNYQKMIAVECCSCRISKILDFLQEIEEIWILTKGYLPWEDLAIKSPDLRMQWFVFKKDSNWDKIYAVYERKRLEELKKIKSPIDALMKG